MCCRVSALLKFIFRSGIYYFITAGVTVMISIFSLIGSVIKKINSLKQKEKNEDKKYLPSYSPLKNKHRIKTNPNIGPKKIERIRQVVI